MSLSNLPAFANKYPASDLSVKTMRTVKYRPSKNQSERSDLPHGQLATYQRVVTGMVNFKRRLAMRDGHF